jgi:hypothetical protein
MKAQSFFEQNGGTYMQVGDYYIPDLKDEEPGHYSIGKYGRMRKRYLQAHRPILFSELTLSGKLYQHLAETDHACKERVELIIRQMKSREGVTEALKAVDQIEWIRRMNSIYNRAEEIVLNELVYC